ncbi:hypothetical protein, partial [Duganella lactea]|uniref:hypothetical protein n=1 Tax=Duganella lactea TaxID=2692173 RepID=UPI001E5FF525
AQLRQLGFALLRSKKVGFHHGRVVKVDALTSCHGRAGFSRPPIFVVSKTLCTAGNIGITRNRTISLDSNNIIHAGSI